MEHIPYRMGYGAPRDSLICSMRNRAQTHTECRGDVTGGDHADSVADALPGHNGVQLVRYVAVEEGGTRIITANPSLSRRPSWLASPDDQVVIGNEF